MVFLIIYYALRVILQQGQIYYCCIWAPVEVYNLHIDKRDYLRILFPSRYNIFFAVYLAAYLCILSALIYGNWVYAIICISSNLLYHLGAFSRLDIWWFNLFGNHYYSFAKKRLAKNFERKKPSNWSPMMFFVIQDCFDRVNPDEYGRLFSDISSLNWLPSYDMCAWRKTKIFFEDYGRHYDYPFSDEVLNDLSKQRQEINILDDAEGIIARAFSIIKSAYENGLELIYAKYKIVEMVMRNTDDRHVDYRLCSAHVFDYCVLYVLLKFAKNRYEKSKLSKYRPVWVDGCHMHYGKQYAEIVRREVEKGAINKFCIGHTKDCVLRRLSASLVDYEQTTDDIYICNAGSFGIKYDLCVVFDKEDYVNDIHLYIPFDNDKKYDLSFEYLEIYMELVSILGKPNHRRSVFDEIVNGVKDRDIWNCGNLQFVLEELFHNSIQIIRIRLRRKINNGETVVKN